MHQMKYSLKIISELGLAASKPACTPIDKSLNLTTKKQDKHTNRICEDDPLIPNKSSNQRLIDKLLYLQLKARYCFQCPVSKSISTISQEVTYRYFSYNC